MQISLKHQLALLGRRYTRRCEINERHCGDELEVKASGGVRNLEDFNKMIDAGATRIGASAGVQIIQGLESDSDY